MGSNKILIVDDSTTAIALFKACLGSVSGNYELISARTWKEGLNQAKEHSPFLCVLDYNMPEVVGIELAKKIKAADVQTYFVLLTANAQPTIVDEAMGLGFVEVLEKPISPELLQPILDKIK